MKFFWNIIGKLSWFTSTFLISFAIIGSWFWVVEMTTARFYRGDFGYYDMSEDYWEQKDKVQRVWTEFYSDNGRKSVLMADTGDAIYPVLQKFWVTNDRKRMTQLSLERRKSEHDWIIIASMNNPEENSIHHRKTLSNGAIATFIRVWKLNKHARGVMISDQFYYLLIWGFVLFLYFGSLKVKEYKRRGG